MVAVIVELSPRGADHIDPEKAYYKLFEQPKTCRECLSVVHVTGVEDVRVRKFRYAHPYHGGYNVEELVWECPACHEDNKLKTDDILMRGYRISHPQVRKSWIIPRPHPVLVIAFLFGFLVCCMVIKGVFF